MESPGWHESILVARSLSHGSSLGPSGRQSGMTYPGAPNHKSSEYTEDGNIETAGLQSEKNATSMHNMLGLPESVAQSLLYELPREIRDRIFSLCLTARDSAPIEWPRPQDSHGEKHLQPQLLRTCRIIYDETVSLLYTVNNITFHHPSDANIFVHSFALSYGRHISNLSLHIKAQDMRLWMPYLTSTDDYRSLKADFPSLKALWVRFRSNNWQHQLTPEANLKSWSDDSLLEEVMAGLRHVFLPGTPPERSQITEREFQSYVARNPTALQEEGDNIQFRRRLLELQKAKANASVLRADAPIIRVCCVCKVHTTHFNALTTPVIPPANPAGEPLPQAPRPVQEGEPFHAFAAVDLQTGIKSLRDPVLRSPSVAQTQYADRNGILLALEIHTPDPKKDSSHRAV